MAEDEENPKTNTEGGAESDRDNPSAEDMAAWGLDENGEAKPTADTAENKEGDMSEEDMAAWGLDGDGDGEGESSRVLNQDEIDSLLGFNSGDNGDDSNTGINAILDKALMAYERLPMLEVVFDRLVRMLSTSYRNFLSDNVDVSIDSMHSLRFGDYLNSIPLPALLFVFKAQEWENFGLITVDSALIYSAVDVLLGGRRANRPIRIEGRPYTTIEQELIKRMVEVTLADMSAAFDPISPVTFHVERLETNPRFATIARPGNASILIRMRVDMEERGGNLELLLPHATMEPIRDLLLQMFMGEKFGRDSVWEGYMTKEVRNTHVTLEAILGEKILNLGDVFKFKVGSTMLLDNSPDDDVIIRCAGTDLFSSTVGRVEKNIAVRVKSKIIPPEGELL